MAEAGHYASCGKIRGKRCWCEVKRNLGLIALTFGVLIINILGGYLSGSVALYAEAAHTGADNVALFVNMTTAILVALGHRREGVRHFAFIASLFLLVFVGFWVIGESFQRIRDGSEVNGPAMILAAVASMALNMLQIRWHARAAPEHQDHAHHAQHGHFMKDVIINVGVVVGGILVAATGWRYVDPIISLLIGLWIFWYALSLYREHPDPYNSHIT